MFDKKITRRSFLTISGMAAASFALDWEKISAHAAKMGPKSDYPTVIIGAGLGGLCCGAYLAKQGIPVTVVEQHSIPGGYATSFDRAGGKFTFDVSLHGTSINNNASARILENLGVLEELELVELPEVYRMIAPGLDISVPQKDPDAYIRILANHFPAEKEGIRKFVYEMLGIAEEADKLHRKKGKFFKLIFPIQYRKMWNVRNKTLEELMSDYVRDPQLKDILGSLWSYYGLPPSKLSGFYYAVATGAYLRNGSYSIRDRSQNLSEALARVIENSGGDILYDTLAEKIRSEQGLVKGVTVSGGKFLPARAVMSNASGITTFREMLPREAVPPDYLKKLNTYRSSISTFIVWLGLNREIRGKIKGFGIHIASGNGSEADYLSCLRGEIDKNSFGVSIYDNIFKGYSAPGTSTVTVMCMAGYEPWQKFEADYHAGRKDAYNKKKAEWTEILIRRAEEKVIPGLSSMIEVKVSATPLTNWRFTRNTEGAIYGFEQSMENAFMNRIENRTPVKGLYLAGAWGNPGGGYSGVLRSGERTFQNMMEDWG